MARRRLPKLDACKVHPERFRRMSPDQLMKVWVRLGMSAPSRTNINGLLKGLVSNLAAAKSSQTTYKDDPVQRRQSMAVYMKIVRNIEDKLRDEQSRVCGIKATEHAAQRAYDRGHAEEAGKLWREVARRKKSRRR